MPIIKILSALAVFGSIAWYITTPGYEPIVAVITSLSALIGALLTDKRARRNGGQTQDLGKNSVGIQAGGDVNINSPMRTKDVE